MEIKSHKHTRPGILGRFFDAPGRPSSPKEPLILLFLLALAALAVLTPGLRKSQIVPLIKSRLVSLSAHYFHRRADQSSEGVGGIQTKIQIRESGDQPFDSLSKTKLPVMELLISPESLEILNKALPKAPANNKQFSLVSGVDGFEWPEVPAVFKYMGRSYEIQLGFRGWNYDHYMLEKKSWKIKFIKPSLFYGMHSVNIINQRVKSVIGDVLQASLLRDAGFLVADQYLVHLRINGRYAGVETFLEQPDKYFLTRHNRPVGDVFGDQTAMVSWDDFKDMGHWQKYSNFESGDDYSALQKLISALEKKKTPGFKEEIDKILDVEEYLAYCADAAITAKVNPSSHNIRLFYDPTIGKIQIIPWYQQAYFYKRKPGWLEGDKVHPVGLIFNDIMDGLFSIPEYYEKYQDKIWKMLNSTYHYSQILQKIEYLHDMVKEDVYADTHIHWGDMDGSFPNRYISNKEWEQAVNDLKTMALRRNKYLREYLRKTSLNARAYSELLSPGDIPEGMNADALRITFMVKDNVSPYVESLNLAWNGNPEDMPDEVRLYKVENGKLSKTFDVPSEVDKSNGEIAFRIGRRFISDKTPVEWDGGDSKPRGLVVRDYPQFFYGAILLPLPTLYEYAAVVKQAAGFNPGDAFEVKKVKARNAVTGEAFDPEIFNSAAPMQPYLSGPEHFLDNNKAEGVAFDKEEKRTPAETVVWKAGVKIIDENLIIGPDATLAIEPGTTVKLAAGKYVLVKGRIIAKGEKDKPIVFERLDPEKPWGVVAVDAPNVKGSVFEHCVVDGGKDAVIDEVLYSGALSLRFSDSLVKNCLIKNNSGDDGINFKYSDLTVVSNVFQGNLDALDVDFGDGLVEGNLFVDGNGDAIDLSYSNIKIADNVVRRCGDKAISVGEKSTPFIYNNLLTGCRTGIAVKDLSQVLILNNTISQNETGISLYVKKPIFGSGGARVMNTIVWGNEAPLLVEDGSELVLEHSDLDKKVEGEGNIFEDPLFRDPSNGDFTLKPGSPCLARGNHKDLSDYWPGFSRKLDDIGRLEHE